MEAQRQPELGPRVEPMRPIPFRIARVRKETHDTFTLDLAPIAGETFAFAPGQFNMLYVFGVGEVPISISGDPGRREVLVHTIRAVGAVTRALQKLRKGDTVGVRGPFGSTWPVEPARGGDVVIVAGGIGLAPLRPALYHVLNHRDRYERVCLFYGARTPADALYARELATLRRRFDLQVEMTVDRAPAETWRGEVGPVTTLLPYGAFAPSRSTAMVCGPEIMIRFVVQALAARGLAPETIYISAERNMRCAIGFCGHCQLGPTFMCKDGPVFSWPVISPFLAVREL